MEDPGTTFAAINGIGRVAAPRGSEANTEEFYFWVPEDKTVEKTQLVYVESTVGGTPVRFFGLVTEVFRRSRRADMLEESDRYDGRPDEALPIESRGVTYAKVRVLAATPNVIAPPREESLTYPAFEAEARIAYGMGEMRAPIAIGLVRNGGEQLAGPAYIDLDYLLGSLGGHLNVTGIAGVATKSSFLTITLRQLLASCERYADEHPEDPEKPQVRAVILNVKGYDLFWLDHWSTAFSEEDRALWRQMGWADPRPLEVSLFAPQQPGSSENAVAVGRPDVVPYSWSLEDVLRDDLFLYLFSDAEREDDNFALLLIDLERLLVHETRRPDGTPERTIRKDAPAKSFDELFDWFQAGLQNSGDATWSAFAGQHHHPQTLRRFYRRLRRIVHESAGIFRLSGRDSHPLDITTLERAAVVDINSLGDRHLQRFVVAALLKQAIDAQTGPGALRGMHYVFVLDELNRFAPRGQTDPITRLIEEVAAELRSRGVILFGAQQQASLVSTRVVENAGIHALGRTGGHELQEDVFKFLPEGMRSYIQQLLSSDKVVHQPSFRQPMQVRVPRPPWAMRRQEASREPPDFLAKEGAAATGVSSPRRIAPKPFREIR